ncbi:MAG: TIGR01906 family membrane protein [Chloroflexi bacterium]|nr:TIGR01906 family membrane protein [Chloroflexota bacterium]
MGEQKPMAWWARVARVLLCVTLPVALLLTTVRLLLTPAFVRLDYGLPGFPQDPYGFSASGRIYWADIALEYLLNDEPISFLGDLQFEDGASVYNERELKHMLDVKLLVQDAMSVWLASLAASLVIVLAMGQFGGKTQAWRALRAASLTTLAVMGVLLVLIAAVFQFVFVGFHRMFFQGDSWLFLYSDTLIRLFPERFWLTAFVAIVAGTIALACLLWLVSREALRSMAETPPAAA